MLLVNSYFAYSLPPSLSPLSGTEKATSEVAFFHMRTVFIFFFLLLPSHSYSLFPDLHIQLLSIDPSSLFSSLLLSDQHLPRNKDSIYPPTHTHISKHRSPFYFLLSFFLSQPIHPILLPPQFSHTHTLTHSIHSLASTQQHYTITHSFDIYLVWPHSRIPPCPHLTHFPSSVTIVRMIIN